MKRDIFSTRLAFFSFVFLLYSTLEKRKIMKSQNLNDNKIANSNCTMLWVWTRTEQAAHPTSACCMIRIVCYLLRRVSTSRLVLANSQACEGFVALLQFNCLLANDQLVLLWLASHWLYRWHRGHIFRYCLQKRKSMTPSSM